jgi:hypothetical protein
VMVDIWGTDFVAFAKVLAASSPRETAVGDVVVKVPLLTSIMRRFRRRGPAWHGSRDPLAARVGCQDPDRPRWSGNPGTFSQEKALGY